MELTKEEIIERVQQPPTDENLSLLPIFTGKKSRFLNSKILHKAYHPNVSVSNILFNNRAYGILRSANIRTIGQLLLSSYTDLLLYRNCGLETIGVFQNELNNFILGKKYDYSQDWEGLSSMLESVLTIKERNLKILLDRIGVNRDKPYTLQQCGEEVGITREAVRQTLNHIFSIICHPETEFKLRPFWSAIDKILKKRDIMTAEELTKKLKEKLSWQVKPEPHAIKQLLYIKEDKYLVTRNDLVGLRSSRCFDCAKLNDYLPRIMSEKPEMPLPEVYNSFLNELEKYCPRLKSFRKRMIRSLVNYQINRNLKEHQHFKKKTNNIINLKLVG